LALTTKLRFFVQERDGISFVQMRELYEGLPVSDQDKELVRQGVTAIEDYLDRRSFLSLGGEQLSDRNLFERFMYGSLAHANPDKAATFEKWIEQPLFRPIAEARFEKIVAELIKCACWLYSVNERALQQLWNLSTASMEFCCKAVCVRTSLVPRRTISLRGLTSAQSDKETGNQQAQSD
jgi:hypothetical protein